MCCEKTCHVMRAGVMLQVIYERACVVGTYGKR